MKVSGLFLVAVILSCFLHEISAYGDCMATCPNGCVEQKDCNFIACFCSCNCNPEQNPPPSTPPPPPEFNPTPPSVTQPPPAYDPTQPGQPNYADQCCVNAGINALACIPEYLQVALLTPNRQFSSYCCQNLKDLQTYCVSGFVPPEVAGIDFFGFDYNYHCPGN